MQVQVVDFLASFFAGVDHDAKTALRVGAAALLAGQARRQAKSASGR